VRGFESTSSPRGRPSISYSPTLSSLNRRGFLGASVAGFAASALTLRRAGAQDAASLPLSAWDELAKALVGGKLVRPGDPNYLTLSQSYNLAYPTPLPAGIAYCVNRDNVQAAIKWCRKFNVRPTARSGGHSYAGFSMTGGLMINTRGMSTVSLIPGTPLVRIAGGALNGELCAKLSSAELAITHGRCPLVGAAGFLLGGGIGFNMRAHGVGSDQLEETELVTAAGDVLTASRTQNPTLFWACRGGGGGNFGINTSFVVRAYPVRPVTIFKIQWAFDQPDPLAVASVLMTTFSDAPDGLGSRLSLHARPPGDPVGEVSVDLIGQFAGPEAELKRLLAPAFAIGAPSSEQIETLPYWQAQKELEDKDPPGRFHERSAFLPHRLDDEALQTAYRFLRAWPGTSQPGGHADLRFFQTGGAMNRPTEPTAFVHRNSKWLMDIGLNWGATDSQQRVDENVAWQNAFYAAMLPYSTRDTYQNFIDPAEYNWAEAYYGSALKTLREVKREVDPGNLFTFPQSIRPAV
jgi:FAD/FMN-containing dehydrogenase